MDGPFAEGKEVVVPGFALPDKGHGAYAPVNGLRMYYEVHGRGRPLVLLHGALTTIDGTFGNVVRALASTRQVIAIEQQAHGRTADIPRPLSYEQMADDSAELLRQLGISQADFFGYTMGAATALHIAVRHPDVVNKLALVSAGFESEVFSQLKLEYMRKFDPLDPEVKREQREDFQRVGASLEQWVAAVNRATQTLESYRGVGRQELQAIRAQTLVVNSEQGLERRARIDELSRLLPRATQRVIPGDDFHPSIIGRSASLIPGFLDDSLSISL